MSWDLFVMDIPQAAQTVDEVPANWIPGSLPARHDLVRAILDIAPEADVSDASWARANGADFSVEVNIGDAVSLTTFALHVRGGELAIGFVAALPERLQLRAFDPGSDTGIFDPAGAADSLGRWRCYRDQVLGSAVSGL